MASRAFFRCRACGEPVVAGAYRCPNCAIDFPAGTPGTPAAPDSPAAVDPQRPERRIPGEEQPLASAVPAHIRADMIASRLDSALGAELAPPAADGEPGPRPDAPAREPAVPPRRDADALAAIVPAAHGSVAAATADDSGPGARLDAVPSGRALPPHDPPEAGLSVAPGRERAAPRPPRVGPEPETGTALVPAPRRRSRAANLAATVTLAVLAVGGAAAALLLLPSRDAGLESTAPAVRVSAADGWVDVPPEGGTVRISADGPYRIRLDGVVYHVAAGRTLNVPTTDATQLSVRTAGGPTVAEVARAR